VSGKRSANLDGSPRSRAVGLGATGSEVDEPALEDRRRHLLQRPVHPPFNSILSSSVPRDVGNAALDGERGDLNLFDVKRLNVWWMGSANHHQCRQACDALSRSIANVIKVAFGDNVVSGVNDPIRVTRVFDTATRTFTAKDHTGASSKSS